MGIALVSLTDTIALSASLAARHDEEVDANQEMVGMGAANLFAGVFSGFAVSASSSRTMVGESAGARTQLAPLFGGAVVLLLLVAFNGVLEELPQPALAAVVIAAAVSLVDLPALRRFAKVRTSAFWLSAVASLAVIFLGVLPGIGVAVVLSVLMFFQRSWWPEGEVLGRDPLTGIWHSLEAFPRATEREGVLVYRWEAQLFFANAGMFRQRIRKLVRERHPRWVVLQCEAITDIDVTAADVLRDLDRELNEAGVHMAFVELRSRLVDRIERYGLHEELPAEHFFDSLDAALTHILLNGSDTDADTDARPGPDAPAD
jgi:MFS superfamily sulfate permease-like transporter